MTFSWLHRRVTFSAIYALSIIIIIIVMTVMLLIKLMIKKQKAVSSLFIRGFTVPLKLSINNRFKTPICPEEDLFALLPTQLSYERVEKPQIITVHF